MSLKNCGYTLSKSCIKFTCELESSKSFLEATRAKSAGAMLRAPITRSLPLTDSESKVQ